MKGLVFDIKRFAVHDGPGIRTTIFLKGCPLNCWWCHNPESQDVKSEMDVKQILLDGYSYEKSEEIGKLITVNEVMEMVEKDAVFFEESGGGVTLSGGEPLMQKDFAIEILRACKAKGFHTSLDTCGYVNSEVIKNAALFTDLFLYDLKHPDPIEHFKFTNAKLDLILKNLQILLGMNKQVVIRIPVIPGINDQAEQFQKFIEIIKSIDGVQEVHFLPYHALANGKYSRLLKENKLAGLKTLDKKELFPAKKLFEENGFTVKIGG
ncbi:MAG: glycyl-radical enzyme activating protein [Bacteroidales bacterium]|nr:glycyl-radical enzyme activating protein [Bacteroidales bacterium]